ncbi:variant erythrocyte surface antigen-1 family protein [Babesia caballi]|uniref:Variant erythrocyte surface antigen-1 family protein n=1 Tax=Babesia caballi TaxID=5871 RepID=A0AAV4LLI2_BABCB|nr:variant erythrocyte surface antigen-1 family protein [Babesia caballi]
MSTKKLTDCPSNLKEAIDWILRVTGKDTVGGSQNGSSQLADAVSKLLEGVQSSSPGLKEKLDEIKGALSSGPNNGIIGALAEGLAKFKEGIKSMNYNSAYESLEWGTFFQDAPTASTGSKTPPEVGAKIFLACLPMIFSVLSYLYWRCSEKGGWTEMKLWGSTPLQFFMESVGFDPDKHLDTGKNGQQVATAFQSFDGFSDAVSKTDEKGFPGFLSALLMNVPTNSVSYTPSKAFVGLHIAAQVYFTHKRSTSPTASPSPPSSIRTMLYWLSGLTITPQFGELLQHIHSMFPSGHISVAISGSYNVDEKLTPSDLIGYLIASSISSCRVLRTIQGRTISGDPLMHNIYCNSEFAYSSSGPALFNALSNYMYALQFQLYFLYAQCASTYSHSCGWRGCKYGSTVNSKNVTSHICSAGCNQQNVHINGDHTSGSRTCKHSDCSNNSPLQAFLSDELTGFRRDPAELSNHFSFFPGSGCHVPMGFSGNLRTDTKPGGNIYRSLEPFCGGSNTPLRQLCEKVGCLTKRTPRTLGDLFGFIWHLNGQLFSSRSVITSLDQAIQSQPKTLESLFSKFETVLKTLRPKPLPAPVTASQFGLSDSLKSIANSLPFWEYLFDHKLADGLPGKLFDVTQHCHKVEANQYKHESADPTSSIPNHNCSQHAADLWSLYHPVGSEPGGTNTDPYKACRDKSCGGYLEPLILTYGATFASSFAPTYLSWMAYLTDDLHEWLSQMLDEFNTIDCENCNHSCTNEKSCHARSNQCACPSVVLCSGVLPLLYRYGFIFTDASLLNGWTYEIGIGWQKHDSTKRSCSKFSTQLSNVLAENAPLHNLLLAIDEFLYYVRFRFMSLVSSFWLCSLAILLYFIFYGIDVLHFKSHVHFPSSHKVPPIGLLTTGKAPALTKLTYYMP